MESEQEPQFPNDCCRIEYHLKFPVNVLSEMKFPARWSNFYPKRAINKKVRFVKPEIDVEPVVHHRFLEKE